MVDAATSSYTDAAREKSPREVHRGEDVKENYRTEGGTSEPYVVKTLSPEIEGVLVVAEGAGSGIVNRTIVEAVQALFGVEAHKVKVVKMEVQSPDKSQ